MMVIARMKTTRGRSWLLIDETMEKGIIVFVERGFCRLHQGSLEKRKVVQRSVSFEVV